MNSRPTDSLAIAVAQLNPTVGDIDGNAAKARAARAQAARDGADLVAFSELFICGYPPEDLVLKPALQAACRAKIEELARETADGGPAMLIGTPWVEDGKLYNAYCLLDGGAIAAVRRKVDLPNYGVFDEKRVFEPGPMPGPVNFRGVRLGVPICEDIWGADVVETLAETGTELMIVPNGSPYHRDKDDVRLNIAVARVTESDLPMVYVNQVGGQDELVFDGASFGLHADRSLAFQLPAFTEQVTTVRWQRSGNTWRCAGGPVAKLMGDGDREDYIACVLGLRDYVAKNGFKGHKYLECGVWPFNYPHLHAQHVVRLPNKNGQAYLMVSQSDYFVDDNGSGTGPVYPAGRISLYRSDSQVDSSDRVPNVSGVDGRIVWEQEFKAGAFPPGQGGAWNHPCKMDVLGNVLVVAMQNWDGAVCADGYGTQADAVVFYDVRDPANPRYWGKITRDELSASAGTSLGNVDDITLPQFRLARG
mgnify:CR=1 FL=1